jgi:MFS family permease
MLLNFDRLLILSFGFLFVFTAFNTAQNLAAKILRDNDLGEMGFYSLASVYASFGACSVFSSNVVKRLGMKRSMFFGSLCYVIYLASYTLACRPEVPKSITIFGLIFTAVVCGFGSSLLWTAQG